MALVESFRSMFKVPELKRRIMFTALILLIYRIGSHVATPGIDGRALSMYFERLAAQGGQTLFGLYDLFVGGNFSNATIFALGIMPYISASIIFQLLGALVPAVQKLQKEGEEGRRKINQYTRYATVALALVQSLGISVFLSSLNQAAAQVSANIPPIVPDPGLGFTLMTVLTLTAGTVFVMWLGEQITERGIGNGISLIIFIGILARYPIDTLNTIRAVMNNQIQPFFLLVFLAVAIGIIMLIIMMTQGQRKVPVQYAKRMIGRRMYGGGSTFIPLRPNAAGVIPIIFAQSLIIFPSTLATSFFPNSEVMGYVSNLMAPGQPLYLVLYASIILFFSYFYTAVIFNPVDWADNLKKQGGFIPGIRPGKKTAEYLDRILTRITLPGSLYLAFVAVLPDWLIANTTLPFYFGGTGLIIVVGVALDTLQQIESHLLMRHYEGFMKKGKLKSARGG
jgi:preprotein translocase subunit SecY